MKTDIVEKVGTVKSSDDFELSIKRVKDVEYLYSYPSNQELKGIVFIIPGFGEDTNSEYSKKLRNYIAQEFSVVAVHVIYHCFYSRVSNGATTALDKPDREILEEYIKIFNLDTRAERPIVEILKALSKGIIKKRESGEIDKNYVCNVPMTIVPKNSEYQNFGLLQALDHINVLQKLREEGLNLIQRYPTILMGSSHGAYIANLVSKFAPNQIDCVIDNSSYTKTPLNYVIGKELDISNGEYVINYNEDSIAVNCFVKTHWSSDKESYNYFSKERYAIRELSNISQLRSMASSSKEKTKYISYHCEKDNIAPIEDKIEYYQKLRELGFDAVLNVISDDSQVDGEFIKKLTHGLDMSMKHLANNTLVEALKIKSDSSNKPLESIVYECDTLMYEFQNIEGVFSASQSPIENIEEKIVSNYQKNIEYFELHQPDLYAKLASFDSAVEQGLYQSRYDLVFNNNSFNVKEFSSNHYLYPSESKKIAYEVGEMFNEKIQRFVFFGTGLGVHIERVNKKIDAKSYLIVEDDLELFKLSILVTPYYEIALKAELFFSVFENDEAFTQRAKNFLNQSDESANSILHYTMANHSRDKLLSFEKLLGKENV